MKSTISTHLNRGIVLYDGTCPLCRKSVTILKRLDWLKQLAYRDARDIEHLPESAVPLDPERLLQEMHVLTPNRQRVHAGFRAFRWISGRLPLLWAFWPMMFFPGVPWVGQRIYLWVAKNRYDLVPCHDGACAVPLRSPTAKKSNRSLPPTPTV